MKIAITGASGFIGRNLMTKLTGHELFPVSRKTINLHDSNEVREYMHDMHIDAVIHTAISGGMRDLYKPDTTVTFHDNITMASNLLSAKAYKLFINLASGAEFDRSHGICSATEGSIFQRCPTDYYGASKNVIARLVAKTKNGLNLRLFGCFGTDEAETRFIAKNIRRYILGDPIEIYRNRVMSYVYIDDLISVIDYHLNDGIIYNDINVVYDSASSLVDIADMINRCSDYRVEVIINNNGFDLPYTGNGKILSHLGLSMIGLNRGIEQCYFQMLNEY